MKLFSNSLRATILGMAVAMTAAPVFAGWFDDDVARKQAQDLSDYTDKMLRQQSETLQQTSNDIHELGQQVLNLANRIDAVKDNQRTQYLALDRRLQVLESGEVDEDLLAPSTTPP